MKNHAKLARFSLFIACLGSISLCSCSSSEPVSYADGTYEGRSLDHTSDSDGNGAGYATCSLTIKESKIEKCTFLLYELDGTLKDENYGIDNSKENYLKAQKAVQAATQYAKQLVEKNDLDGVKVISGATITFTEFQEAVDDALSKAKA